MPLTNSNEQPSPIQTAVNNISNAPAAILGSVSHAAESAAEHVAEKTAACIENNARKIANDLTEKALNYFQNLLEKKNAVDQDRQRLHAIILDYNSKKSRFTQWAEWYGTLAWYEELGYVIAFVAISALVGFAFNLAALFTLISIGISYLISSLLIEHYEIASTQNDALIAGVTAMIDNLVVSIEQLTVLAREVNTIQLELNKKCVQMDDELKVFKEQITQLDRQIGELKNETDTLKRVKDTLVQENERINLQRDMASIETIKANATITEQSIMLSDIQQKLDEAHQQFLTRNDELIQVSAQIKFNAVALSEVREDYEHELTFFKSHRTLMVANKGSASSYLDEKQPTMPDIEQQLEDSDAMLLKAALYIKNHSMTH